MGRFINDTTEAIVSVADEKDHRFGDGWTPLAKGEKPKSSPTKSETPDETWTNKELDEFATANNIDFTKVSNKPSRLEAIAAHVAASAGQ